ncbi:MAG: HDOD domain-containing protein [Pseudodesulfovibrio sp.]|nr:HDOD domain-containing protein [Pseudodesulfovibrio sp.]
MTEGMADPGFQVEQALIVRQPIFDRDKMVWGYELLTNSIPLLSDGTEATSLSGLILAYQENLSGLGDELSTDKKILLPLTEKSLLSSEELPNGWENCVFGVCQQAASSPECPKFVDFMKHFGGMMSLDASVDPLMFNEFVDHTDIIKVSLAGKTPPEIVQIRRKYKDFKGELLATDISSWEAYEGTRALGFKYFQGPFFAIAQIQEDKDLSASSIAKLQLLRELGNPDCEMDELASIIAADVSLSYRIFKYINSASFGLKNKIKSIQQAVALLGLKEVRHWATVVVMSDLDSTPKGEELSYMALQRGRFLSKLTGTINGFPHSANTMFMLGLFSQLDALLSFPMKKALEGIPMDDAMKDGLCGTLNEFRDWLRLLEAVEVGNWGIANDILGKYGACLTQAANQYMKAAGWAAKQLPDMKK